MLPQDPTVPSHQYGVAVSVQPGDPCFVITAQLRSSIHAGYGQELKERRQVDHEPRLFQFLTIPSVSANPELCCDVIMAIAAFVALAHPRSLFSQETVSWP